ncbi:hypothetical protein B6A27_00395 [Anoxybacillus sp. UARK-01]|nr:hypothetical protein B6A27_00395 [Anoxybacillus sp. UARK-01]
MGNEMKLANEKALLPFRKQMLEVEKGYYSLAQSMGSYTGTNQEFMDQVQQLGAEYKKASDAMINANKLAMASMIQTAGQMMNMTTQAQRISDNYTRMANPIYNVNKAGLAVADSLNKIANNGNAAVLSLKMLGPNASMKELLNMQTMINQGLMRFSMVALAALATGVIVYGGLHKAAMESNEEYKKSFETMVSKLKEAFQPMVEVFADVMTKVYDFVSAIADMIIKFNEAHPTLAKIIQGFLMLIPALTLVLSPLAIGIGLFNGMLAAWSSIWMLIGPLVTGLAAMSATVWVVAGAIVGLVAVGVLLYKNWDEIKEYLLKTWEAIKSVALSVWGGIKAGLSSAWEAIKSAAISIWDGIKEFFSTLWTSIIEIAYSIWNPIAEFFSNLWNSILETLKNIWNKIKETAIAIWTPIWDYFDEIVYAFLELFQTVWQAIVIVLSEVWNNIKETAITVWNAIKEFFLSLLNQVKDNFLAIWNEVKTVLQTVWNTIKSVAEPIWNGLKEFFINWLNSIKETFSVIWNNIKSVVQSVWNTIYSVVSNIVSSIRTAISNGFNAAWNTVGSIMNSIKSTITNIWSSIVSIMEGWIDKFQNIGSDIVKGLWNGIKSMASWIKDKIIGFANGITDEIKNFFGIHSPSTLFAEYGGYLSEGLAIGITADSKLAENSMLDLAERISGVGERLGQLVSGSLIPQPILSFGGANNANGMLSENGEDSTTIIIQNMNVRSDQDILRISRELYSLQRQSKRSRGER